MEKSLPIVAALIFLTHRLSSLRYEPDITTNEWCSLQPCLSLGGYTLSVPSSSLFIFSLAILTIVLGFKLNDHIWRRGLIFWGIGALSAGISYQLLGFELKCAGRDICIWTTPWELVYMVFTMAAIAKMLEAITGNKKLAYGIYFIYSAIIIIAGYLPIRFLISFEFFVIIAAPCFLTMFVLNVLDYKKTHNEKSKMLSVTWVALGSIIIVYYLYYLLGITELLWEHKIWFSENDVLHILLIGWMVLLYTILKNQENPQESFPPHDGTREG